MGRGNLISMMAAAGKAATIYKQIGTYGSTTDNTSHSVSFPNVPVSGNLLILCANSNNLQTTPAGWTSQIGLLNDTHTVLYSKVAGASEPQTVTVTVASGGTCELTVMEFEQFINLDPIGSNTGTGTSVSENLNFSLSGVHNEIVIACVGTAAPVAGNGSSTVGPVASTTGGYTKASYLEGLTSSGGRNTEMAVYLIVTNFVVSNFPITVNFTTSTPAVINAVMASFYV